jgi:hypothetical protein
MKGLMKGLIYSFLIGATNIEFKLDRITLLYMSSYYVCQTDLKYIYIELLIIYYKLIFALIFKLCVPSLL